MDPFERELRERFRKQEPSSGFSNRVMAEIRRPAGAGETPRPWWLAWNRWAFAGAAAACLTLGFVVQQQQGRQHRQAQLEAAQIAETQLAEQLFFAGEKINQARDRVWGPRERGEQ